MVSALSHIRPGWSWGCSVRIWFGSDLQNQSDRPRRRLHFPPETRSLRKNVWSRPAGLQQCRYFRKPKAVSLLCVGVRWSVRLSEGHLGVGLSGVAPGPSNLRDQPLAVITESKVANTDNPDFSSALSERLKSSGIVLLPLETSKPRRVSRLACCTCLTKSSSATQRLAACLGKLRGDYCAK